MSSRGALPRVPALSFRVARAARLALPVVVAGAAVLALAAPRESPPRADGASGEGAAPRTIERIVQEETDAGTERGLVSEYVADQKDALIGWFLGFFPDASLWTERTGRTVARVALFLAIAAAALVLLLVIRRTIRRLRDARPEEPAARPLVHEVLEEDEPDLQVAIEACLARGDRRAAVAAVWRHLVRRLARREIGRVDERLTNREYVRRVRRSAPDWPGHARLRGFARRVERALYGPDAVEREDVVRLVEAAEELVQA